MVYDKNLASSIGGKTARACDSCITKRARWYCAADDVFLCQTCDASIHSANPSARRHTMVRLNTASEKQVSLETSWHHGFTRKARTPRHGKNPRAAKSKSHETQRNLVHHLVPDLGPDENSYDENEEQEQLLYRVPVFDSFAAELCLSGTSNVGVRNDGEINDEKYKLGMVNNDNVNSSLHGIYDHMNDLEEFAVDVESLFGKGLDEESSFDMETLRFLDCREKESTESSSRSSGLTVKQEEEGEEEMEGSMGNVEMDMTTRETFKLNLDDYELPVNCEEEENDNKGGIGGTSLNIVKQKEDKKKMILLALDYEGVIAAWGDQKSPWTDGDRPELDPNECWPDFMGGTRASRVDYGDVNHEINIGTWMMLDGGRQARVSRYREKRRTRLFSKKIRYEVRKLNAEKRPRIKGRFVKRSNFPAGSGPGPYPSYK